MRLPEIHKAYQSISYNKYTDTAVLTTQVGDVVP